MDFTREPTIETVITPKEGCKIVVRSSKGAAQEEFFVDAVEVVSFGNSFFFRSLERPKAFLVPVTDYEILEVREARMVLKNVGFDRSIKIGGGKKETAEKSAKESVEAKQEPKIEKKRERRRHTRRRRGRDEGTEQVEAEEVYPEDETAEPHLPQPETSQEDEVRTPERPVKSFGSILPPPSQLISETLSSYKNAGKFKEAFFEKQAEETSEEESGETDEPIITVEAIEEDDFFASEESFPEEEESEDTYKERFDRALEEGPSTEESFPMEPTEPSSEQGSEHTEHLESNS